MNRIDVILAKADEVTEVLEAIRSVGLELKFIDVGNGHGSAFHDRG